MRTLYLFRYYLSDQTSSPKHEHIPFTLIFVLHPFWIIIGYLNHFKNNHHVNYLSLEMLCFVSVSICW